MSTQKCFITEAYIKGQFYAPTTARLAIKRSHGDLNSDLKVAILSYKCEDLVNFTE
jgi:hypothetical protein